MADIKWIRVFKKLEEVQFLFDEKKFKGKTGFFLGHRVKFNSSKLNVLNQLAYYYWKIPFIS